MRDPSFYVSGLLDLDRTTDPAERRAIWRQSMATLARATSEGPGPLEGLQPEALLKGLRPALQGGLADDLDWLAPAAAAGALYELANALPVGPEQRDLGRRVLERLLAANAEAFVQIATRMARTSGKGLGSAPVRARIALATELPLGVQIPDGALALALAAKRELAREFLVVPSMRSLPSRRLAARLFERAAREASRRAAQGEQHGTRPFAQDVLMTAWTRLLSDRESLVWRHIAVARGLLAPWMPEQKRAVETELSVSLSPTEWRRAATSAAALAAVSPDAAVRLCTGAQANAVLEKDPGSAAAFVWGIARAAEAEPDAAAAILDHVGGRAPLEVAEAVLELRAEYGASALVDRAAGTVLAALARAPSAKADDGAEALRREIARDLELAPRDDAPLRDQLAAALLKFHTDGARAAYTASLDVLDAAQVEIEALEAVAPEEDEAEGRGGSLARRTSLAVLRDLDASLLEKNLLGDLLRLGEKETIRAHDEAVDGMRERLSEWILVREREPLVAQPKVKVITPTHPTLRMRRLRALLHLVDGDVGDAQEDATRTTRLRLRWLKVAAALLRRFEADPPSMLRRTIVAALARALDALVRVGACDVADVLLVVARRVTDPVEFETLAEASMDPDLIHVLTRWAVFLRASTSKIQIVAADELPPQSIALSVADPRAIKLRALGELSRELAPDASGRIESLRAVLERLHSAVVAVSAATSLQALSTGDGSEPDVLVSLESWLGSLAQLGSGALARLSPSERASMPPPSTMAARPLSVAVARVLSGAEAKLEPETLRACVDELLGGAPAGVARVVSGVVWGLADLPSAREEEMGVALLVQKRLPDWLPPRRTLGGFYVIRGLGAGNVGSVFVVTRYEDRHETKAERFALKVPEYSATAARSLSEAQFLDLFRSEASALLAIPSHPNVARFVTFDVGARPKPILVMELVPGVTLERVIRSRSLDMERSLRLLDDVLAGLEAMHGAGVGHLDLKPSNVVIRDGDEAVLVDFGLAGRHIRPGCGTGPYGAPEVWGAIPDGVVPTPMAADVYAFGCLAYEALTGEVLFDAETEVAQIAQHVGHDGMPPKLAALGARAGMAPLVELLRTTLRHAADKRPSAAAVRATLRRVAPQLAGVAWPGPAA